MSYYKQVVRDLLRDSVIELGANPSKWKVNATTYASQISRSRLVPCFFIWFGFPPVFSLCSRAFFDFVITNIYFSTSS